MINASSAFRRKLNNDERDYLEQISMTLKDGTELSLTNADIWGGSLSFDDSVGSDGSFSALGSCIVNSLKFTLNNIYDDFSEYDFLDAAATVKIGLDIDGTPEMLKKGVFTVVDPTYNGSTISLVLHDNMAKFDRPYSDSTLVYPASLDTIVRNLCTVCGVNLATSSLNFPRKDFVIDERPSDEATTCREVLSWCATIAGCFARCNTNGELELKWFDISLFDDPDDDLDGGSFDTENQSSYTTGDTADGGTFDPWNTGYVADGGSFVYNDLHIISGLYSQNIAVDDVVITQVQTEVKSESDTGNSIVTYSEGNPGYAIKITGNEFINTTNAQDIVSYLGNQLIGLTFRKVNISHTSDPTIEAGDCALVFDRKNNQYRILVTRTNFNVGSSQTTVCGASTPARNSATRYTEQTKSYVELRKKLLQQKSTWEQSEEDLINRINNADGLHATDVVQQDQSVIHYLHNKPLLNESDIRIMVSNVGITVTANGTAQNPIWYGLTVDGQLIASILNAIGVNADWIRSGTLLLGGTNSNAGLLEVYNANGVKIGYWDRTGINISNGNINLGNGNFVVNTSGNMVAKSGTISQFTFDTSSLIYNSGGISGEYDRSYKDKIYIGGNTGIAITRGNNEHSIVLHNGEITFGTLNIPGMTFRQQDVTNNWWYTFEAYDCRREFAWLKYSSTGYFNLSLTSQTFTFRNQVTSNPWLEYSYADNTADMAGNLTVRGTKSRSVATNDYSNRLLYCYETPSPMFGDVGEGVISDDGKCYVMIDSIFAETVNLSQYQVFLQKYGNGDCWVCERKTAYFVVEGTPGLSFGWELKAKQLDFDQYRLEEDREPMGTLNSEDYGISLLEHINAIHEERTVNAA